MASQVKVDHQPAHSLQIVGKVNSKEMKFLVDSGAVVSIISRECALNLDIETLPNRDHQLIGANGVQLIVTGVTTNTLIDSNNQVFKVRFIILKEFVAPAMLGSDFLIDNKITFDFEHLLMKTEDCQIPLLARGIRDGVVLVQTNEKVRLNGQRDIHSRVRRHNKGRSVPVRDRLYVYKPNGFLWNIQEEEEIPLAIVQVYNSTLPVPINVKDPQIQLF